MTQTQNEAEFEFEWLLRQKYEFKILTLIAVLADNNLAYRGTLKDMCEFFGVKSGDSTNNKNIKVFFIKVFFEFINFYWFSINLRNPK
jgi:hypothetical protein